VKRLAIFIPIVLLLGTIVFSVGTDYSMPSSNPLGPPPGLLSGGSGVFTAEQPTVSAGTDLADAVTTEKPAIDDVATDEAEEQFLAQLD